MKIYQLEVRDDLNDVIVEEYHFLTPESAHQSYEMAVSEGVRSATEGWTFRLNEIELAECQPDLLIVRLLNRESHITSIKELARYDVPVDLV